ncbi:hypothetical protein EMIHUDRAFT_222272 [Emiliania huxleyi CCMP1516]|uniref:SET domain-containing protein n=2 Tax=Emiliania huxleyi TaxID=2903 RepID=A0A0D3KYQ0_EMIH1|nr:hypothetical protein EMIHUDRAFT_222272 [Emiliania huxleyi CCMP1516]EOD40885.1 hypothetical protein EMIHUDRAFT_222272 [Emiliania huxleyi CCMP1516]|eukprot:XP_005793314.1 hypothetical protein EMIHUDRAFT_222272 [Emiliania huxleyi CCMP1516]
MLRPPAEYAAASSTLDGVTDAEFARAWAAASSNGFHHVGTDGRERFLLYAHLSVLNHSQARAAERTTVYAIRDVTAGEELCICYLPDALPCAPPPLRRAFLRHRFEFECECPRCAGRACDADGRDVRGQLDERKRLIGLQLKEYSSFDEALAATDAFMAEHAPRLATTHWMRHQRRRARDLRST